MIVAENKLDKVIMLITNKYLKPKKKKSNKALYFLDRDNVKLME